MKGLQSERNWKRLLKWVKDNLANPDDFYKIDWDAEVDRTLTFNEAIELIMAEYPGLWKSGALTNYYKKVKRIVFIKPLIDKIISGEIKVTYRKTPKYGLYYVITNRFKPFEQNSEPKIIIEFYRSEKVNPYELTDEDAKLAGIDTADEIRRLFEKWYGKPIPMLYRNWLKVKSIG